MLVELLSSLDFNPRFTTIEVGSLPIHSRPEPFHSLLTAFPGSRNLAFEPDEALCERLNGTAPPGMEFHAKALGGRHESRTFYATTHPMCSSLYEPDESWADLFNNLDIMRQARTGSLEVTTLERFAAEQRIGQVDFIKADIQGAELEFLRGAGDTLMSVLCIVCEVEFVALYKEQPLFGEVDAFLRSKGFMFHKFLGVAGRAMKPITINNDPNIAIQHMWSDAVFVRDLREPGLLSDEQLLKLAVLMEIYASLDVCHYLLAQFDARRGTHLAEEFVRRMMQSG